jgi:hypothetical protein
LTDSYQLSLARIFSRYWLGPRGFALLDLPCALEAELGPFERAVVERILLAAGSHLVIQ